MLYLYIIHKLPMKFKLIFKIYLILGLILAINLVSLPMLQAETLEPLKLTQITISPGENSVKVNWSTNYPGWGRINFGPTPEHGSWIETTQNEARHEMWLSGLNVDQKYYFQINAYDIYGRPFISGNCEFTTRKENDTTSPALYNINTSYVTGNTATFVWQTNEPANTCVFYGLSMANLDQNKCDNHRTNVHDLTVTKLIRNTTYYYRV